LKWLEFEQWFTAFGVAFLSEGRSSL